MALSFGYKECAPKCTITRQKKSTKMGDGGIATSPDPSSTGEGDTPIPPPQTPPPRRLRRSAFPFLFIYDSNTAFVTDVSLRN